MVRKAYYQIGMVTLFTVLLGVSVNVYLALSSPSETEIETELLTTVNPKIDETTLASISARIQIGNAAIETVKTFSVVSEVSEVSETSEVSEVSEASGSAEENSEGVATP